MLELSKQDMTKLTELVKVGNKSKMRIRPVLSIQAEIYGSACNRIAASTDKIALLEARIKVLDTKLAGGQLSTKDASLAKMYRQSNLSELCTLRAEIVRDTEVIKGVEEITSLEIIKLFASLRAS